MPANEDLQKQVRHMTCEQLSLNLCCHEWSRLFKENACTQKETTACVSLWNAKKISNFQLPANKNPVFSPAFLYENNTRFLALEFSKT